MKAAVMHGYGGPEVVKYEEISDPVVGNGEVLVRVAATSVNPIDYKIRAGAMKDFFPTQFPAILGRDVSGTIVEMGPGAQGFAKGERVFGMTERGWAEVCAVKTAHIAKIPEGLDVEEAGALPLVVTTGNQLITRGADVKKGQTVLVTGAAGSVGRSAVFTAKDRGATVIAEVLGKQMDAAKSIGADSVVATDDEKAIGSLPALDAVADTVGGKLAEKLMGKVKKGGLFASVLGAPGNAKEYPEVKVVPVYAAADAKTLLYMAQAVVEGKLVIPIGQRFALKDTDKAMAAAEKGGSGKVLIVVGGK